MDVPYPLLKAWHELMKTQKNDVNITRDTAISRNVTNNNRQIIHCAAPTQ